MAADDGAGTPKIDAAQDAAVDLLGSLPPSTQVGLRVFGGTKPSRPIGPACRDSSLVLPIGPLDRAQAEQQIRSFKAKGRTPIAYALERAAEDLGTVGPADDHPGLRRQGHLPAAVAVPGRAQRIANGGVEMRIQAIGFNVDRTARRELQCIAKAGGGVYTDADNAATLKEQLRVLSTRALRQYVPRGKPVRGGPSARQATTLVPGRYVDGMLPDSERWYAVELRRGETLKASASFIPPKRDIADHASLARARLDIVTPSFDIPDRQNSSSTGYPFQRRGFVDGFGVVSRPIGVGAQADPDARFSQPGRYYLKLALKDTDAKDLFNATGGQPYPVELAVEVLGRHGGAPVPSKGPQPQQRSDARGGRLAQRAPGHRAARPHRRWPGGARLRRWRRVAPEEGRMSARRRMIVAIAAAALALPAPASAQGGAAKPVVGGGSFNTAPLLAPGTYSDTVAAGETVYWKVRMAKGQVLQVKATVDTSQIQTDALADDYDRGLAGLEYHLDIFSPLREQLSEESGGIYADASARLEGSADAGAKSGTATGPRVLGFEQILASDYDKAKFPAPGEWYVSLNAADSALAPANVPAELPIEVDVQVLGPAAAAPRRTSRARCPGPRSRSPRRRRRARARPRCSPAPTSPPTRRSPSRSSPSSRSSADWRSARWPSWCSGAGARRPTWRASRSSSSRSTRRARCTTTCASRSTACSSPGPFPRARRPTRARSAWRSPSRTTRWTTRTSRARSARAATAPAR